MKVYLTRRAERNYSSIKEFLLERWGQQVATAFEVKVRQFLELLPDFPSIGTLEVPDKQIRSFPITSQTRTIMWTHQADSELKEAFLELLERSESLEITTRIITEI